jgi:hypothetical protein
MYNVHLDLGDSAKGWVYFGLKPTQKAKALRFKALG